MKISTGWWRRKRSERPDPASGADRHHASPPGISVGFDASRWLMCVEEVRKGERGLLPASKLRSARLECWRPRKFGVDGGGGIDIHYRQVWHPKLEC
jgi:hypothetical protein